MQSTTKFIGGHSDLLGGSLATRDAGLAERLRASRTLLGTSPGALEVFLTLRSARFVGAFASVPEKARPMLKDTIRWNIDQGINLTPVEIAAAEARRADLYQGLLEFFTNFDFLALPADSVPAG